MMKTDLEMTGVIFGASSGIGLATARAIAGHCKTLYVLSRRTSPVVDECENCIAIRCDVRHFQEIDTALQQIAEKQSPAFLVNAVGVGYYAPFTKESQADWQEIVETNILGLTSLVSVVLARLPALSTFIQIGSAAAYRRSSTPGNALYSASKAAAISILEQFRVDLRRQERQTRVSSISPGFVEGTDFGENFYRSLSSKPEEALYGKFKALTPEEVAEAVKFVILAKDNVEIYDLRLRSKQQPGLTF